MVLLLAGRFYRQSSWPFILMTDQTGAATAKTSLAVFMSAFQEPPQQYVTLSRAVTPAENTGRLWTIRMG
jgi:hypothetical protein